MSEPRRITERYRLEKRVSSKDSGSVFRAVDTLSGETVAVKLINAGDSEEHREPFENHLAALREVLHPALPRILDFGFTTAGSAFLVTEYLAGVDLDNLADSPAERILAILLQVVDGLEALAAHGLAARNLSPENLRAVTGPKGEQVKILGLGSAALDAGWPGAPDHPADLRAFAHLTIQALGLPVEGEGNDASALLPLHVASTLTEPERLREMVEAALRGDPEGRLADWNEVRRALRTALFGGTGQRPAAVTTATTAIPAVPAPPAPLSGGTAQIPRIPAWEEVRLGQGVPQVPWQEDPGDSTLAVERLGPAPAPPPPLSGTMILGATQAGTGTAPGVARPAPPATPDLTTRVIHPEELAPHVAAPPPAPPGGATTRIEIPGRAVSDAGRAGTVRIALKDLEPESPPSGTLRFPSPLPPPPPQPASELEETLQRRGAPLPFPAPPQEPKLASDHSEGRTEDRAEDRTPTGTAARPVPPPPPPPPLPAPVVEAAPPPLPPPAPAPAAPLTAAAPVKAAAKPQTAAPRRPPGKGLRVALLVGVPAVLLLMATVALVAWMSRRSAQPDPQPQVQAAPPPRPVPKPVQPVAAPLPVHAQIFLAEESLNASDLAAAQAALDAIPPEQIALFTSEEQDRYQRALDALTPLQSQQWAETLTQGLSKGDLRLLRAATAAPPDAATLTPEQKKDLARARKIADLDNKLSRAQRAKNQTEILRQASLLLTELPRNSRAGQARAQAADALLAEADARAGQGQLDAALAALEQLREEWRDHPGLAERLERIRAERRADEQMEEALAAVTRAERAERPLDGLQALDRVRPNERFAERFRQARERLQAQFAQLDRNPPQIAMSGSSELAYEKGATVKIPLRITDDQGVKSTEAWARPEGGRFTRVTVRSLGGAEHEIEISPDLHQNKNIDFYVEATDQSGHKGSLGNVQRPQKIKRKKWFDKIRGDRDGE